MTNSPSTDATARPWRVEEGTTLIWGACNPDDLSSYGMGYQVAKACLSRGWNQRHEPTVEQATANAALIVEAVNAYESLKARLAEVEGQRAELASKLSHLVDSLKHAEARALDAEDRIAVLEKALEAEREYWEAADCECDGYHGVTCGKHRRLDVISATLAKQKEAGK